MTMRTTTTPKDASACSNNNDDAILALLSSLHSCGGGQSRTGTFPVSIGMLTVEIGPRDHLHRVVDVVVQEFMESDSQCL
jgi:hypothetical protein